MTTFAHLLWQRAEERAEDPAYRLFEGGSDGDAAPTVLSYGALWQRAATIALALRDRGWRGERALLVCETQASFMIAFYACLLAGVVAVPTAVPRRQHLAQRLQALARDARAGVLIFDSASVEREGGALDARGAQLARFDLRRFATREETAPGQPVTAAERLALLDHAGSDIAFLQYTSGSTGDPRGVVVSHANLMANSAEIGAAMEITAASAILTALPLFHDMGLIGGLLQPLHAGCTGHLMSPVECVQYPERWIRRISTHGITVSGGPNFMYDLAGRDIAPAALAGVDLSRWAVAFCGAEPIRQSVVERFCARFAPHGFRRAAFYPCYGLAEATLFVAGAAVGGGADFRLHEGRPVAGCGRPRADTALAIVDPDSGLRRADGAVGEIWITGPGVAGGYWMRPQPTRETFAATFASAPARAWLRSGDLGFIRDGGLYVTGRLKDLIIVDGRNHAPHDLEEEAERSHPALRAGASAAFPLQREDGEVVVLVAELERTWMRRTTEWPEVVATVRDAIYRGFKLRLAEVCFIKPGALPRTSSGKVRRAQCRAEFAAGLYADTIPA